MQKVQGVQIMPKNAKDATNAKNANTAKNAKTA